MVEFCTCMFHILKFNQPQIDSKILAMYMNVELEDTQG